MNTHALPVLPCTGLSLPAANDAAHHHDLFSAAKIMRHLPAIPWPQVAHLVARIEAEGVAFARLPVGTLLDLIQEAKQEAKGVQP